MQMLRRNFIRQVLTETHSLTFVWETDIGLSQWLMLLSKISQSVVSSYCCMFCDSSCVSVGPTQLKINTFLWSNGFLNSKKKKWQKNVKLMFPLPYQSCRTLETDTEHLSSCYLFNCIQWLVTCSCHCHGLSVEYFMPCAAYVCV